MALTDVLRKMASEALEKGSCSGPLWQIIAMGNELEQDEILALRVNDERRRELVKGEKRLKNSYITNTCNRMSALQHADKSVSVKFGENESGDKTLTLKIKSGRMKIGSRGKGDLTAERRGARELAARLMEVSPPISHYKGEALVAAAEVVEAMRSLISRELQD